MRVLLIGEFSSLHKYLKYGLEYLGHDVTLAANGDSWKKISGADLSLINYKGKGIKNIYSSYIEPWIIAKKLIGFDVVQLVEPLPYPWLINTPLIKYLKQHNRLLSLVSAGGDYANVRAYNAGVFEFYAWDYDKFYLERYNPNSIKGKIHIKNALSVENMADIIIPIFYEYAVGYETPKQATVIPYGLNLEELLYEPNIIQEKIVFFHGLNSELKKGTPFIREALERLQKHYPDDVEVIIDGHMPFDQYVEVMKKANVVIDQCCTYAYGINAGIAMAEGKVVMSGAREETLELFGIEKCNCPIISITPDVNQIYDELERLVLHPAAIPEIGKKSREYVEKVHDYKNVARQYVDAWKKTGKI